jgi:erythromycin esterase
MSEPGYNPVMRRLAFLLPAVVFAQTNLDFREGSAGAEPTGWVVPQTAGYRVELRNEGCRGAGTCAVLISPAAPSGFGNLMQSFPAAPYRGKPVRLRAWIRIEPSSPSDRAQMWLRVDNNDGQPGFFDNMGDRPITSQEWKEYEITGEAGENASAIYIGVMSFGKGRVWVGGVTFEAATESDPAATAEAKEALQKLYARIDAAYAAGDLDAITALSLPDATIHLGPTTIPLPVAMNEIRRELEQGWKYNSKSTVASVRIFNDTAIVSVNSESLRTKGDEKQKVATSSRDTWTKTAAGWRMRDSNLVAVRNLTAPTDPEAAKPVIAELKQRAVPLAGVQAGSPMDDLAAFGKAVGDARIVALGEASHGTREFFQMKHRLLEYLVKEKGFTVFAIEANWPESLAVDRYIKTGEGDPRAALAGMYFWTWNTQEVLEMIEWMRSFNKAPGKHPILTFTSFDMQTSKVAAQRALDYLKQYAPDAAGPAATAYTAVQDIDARGKAFDEGAQTAADKAAGVLKVFDSRRAELIAASSAEAWRDARQAAAIVYQACAMRTSGKGPEYRDQMMAGNVEWLASQVHPKEKIVLWAHNGHVAFYADGSNKCMGAWLRQRYGKQLYVLGFGFRRGQLRAVGSRNGKYTGVAVQDAPPAPEGYGDAILAGAGLPLYFLDIAGLPATGPLARWLGETHLFYDVGAVWNADVPEANLQPQALSKMFDGLIFVEETHAARGN